MYVTLELDMSLTLYYTYIMYVTLELDVSLPLTLYYIHYVCNIGTGCVTSTYTILHTLCM